jgi:hypothetical protein
MQGELVKTKDYGRVHNPYDSALLVCENYDKYYELVIPLENVPSPYGDVETFEYNIATEKTKGMTKGKQETQAASTDFLTTRENVYRLDQLVDKNYSYMVVYGNGMGYTFDGELSYRFNDVDNSDNLKGTVTVTPSSIGDTIMDIRKYIRQTLTFAGTIPEEIVLSSSVTSKTIDCAVKESSSATVTVEISGDGASYYDVTWSSGKLTVKTKTGITAPAYALVNLTAKSTETMSSSDTSLKYAPYTIMILLSYSA